MPPMECGVRRGMVFDLDTLNIQEIREQADYPAMRVRVAVSIGPWTGTAVWDVSTGDPMVPAPRKVTIERLLGDPISLLGYAPETTIAEKGVTILERGITSTRWRDYVDIVQLARQGIDRRKEQLESVCEENLDEQITLVIEVLDSAFVRGPE